MVGTVVVGTNQIIQILFVKTKIYRFTVYANKRCDLIAFDPLCRAVLSRKGHASCFESPLALVAGFT